MIEVSVEKVIDRSKVASAIHAMLDQGISLIGKEALTTADFHKIKAFRALNAAVNSAVSMVQQETAQQRAAIIVERMKQLGFGVETPKIEQ